MMMACLKHFLRSLKHRMSSKEMDFWEKSSLLKGLILSKKLFWLLDEAIFMGHSLRSTHFMDISCMWKLFFKVRQFYGYNFHGHRIYKSNYIEGESHFWWFLGNDTPMHVEYSTIWVVFGEIYDFCISWKIFLSILNVHFRY